MTRTIGAAIGAVIVVLFFVSVGVQIRNSRAAATAQQTVTTARR